jgi:hypothetical protein
LNARTLRSFAAAAVALLSMLVLAAPAFAAPANDEISAAQVLPEALPTSSTPGTTVGATGEPGEKIFGSEAKASVWYSWKAPVTGQVLVDLCGPFSGSGPSTGSGIGVYTGTGTTWASLTKVTDTNGPCKLKFSAVAGTTYKIQVNTFFGEAEFVIALHVPQPPANDNFASAQAVSGLPFSVPGSTIDATPDAGEPEALGKGGSSRSVWFTWTAPSSGHVQLEGCPFETQRGSAANHAMGVYTGTTLPGLAKVVETNNCKVEFDVVAATSYKIAFSGHFAGEGTFTLALHAAPQPINDNLAGAATIGPDLPLAISGDNSFATTETGENEVVIGGFKGVTHSVWYQWTPAVSERVKLNACESESTPLIGALTGNTIATLKNEIPPQGHAPFCQAEIEAVAGTTYKIAIAGTSFEGSTGPFTLEIHRIRRPENDELTSAPPIGPDLPIAVDGTNVDGSVEPEEVNPAYFLEPIETVWYRWDSTFSGPVDISTCNSEGEVFAGVHTGLTFATMNLISPEEDPLEPDESEEPGFCSDPELSGAQNRFDAVAGTTYWIQVSAFDEGFEGAFHLTITDPNAKPPAIAPPPPVPPAARLTSVPPPHKPTLKDAIAQCRKRFPGKGKEAAAKRAGCIVKARLKFALAKCREGADGAPRRKCVAAAHQRYPVEPHPRQG